jgi:hypothetical protein
VPLSWLSALSDTSADWSTFGCWENSAVRKEIFESFALAMRRDPERDCEAFKSAELGYAQLQGASLFRAQLQGASLREAELLGAELGDAQLQGASFMDAQLQGASLMGSDLTAADMTRAVVWRAKFDGSRIETLLASNLIWRLWFKHGPGRLMPIDSAGRWQENYRRLQQAIEKPLPMMIFHERGRSSVSKFSIATKRTLRSRPATPGLRNGRQSWTG